jgi:hypothetical protein
MVRFQANLRALQQSMEIAGGKEKAAEWVWLIANHGSDYLIPQELTVNWFLYYELDVAVAGVLAVALVVGILFAFYRCCCRCCRKSKTE